MLNEKDKKKALRERKREIVHTKKKIANI